MLVKKICWKRKRVQTKFDKKKLVKKKLLKKEFILLYYLIIYLLKYIIIYLFTGCFFNVSKVICLWESLNPHQTGVSEYLIQRKSAI